MSNSQPLFTIHHSPLNKVSITFQLNVIKGAESRNVLTSGKAREEERSEFNIATIDKQESK